MNESQDILFLIFMITLGLLLISGAYRRWRWLVDPPTELWPFYSQSLIKKLFGKHAVVYFTYLVGFGIIVISIMGISQTLNNR
jgi:hypothetical protein